MVLAIGLGIRLPILLADSETILGHWGSDDLFYFTGIASHLAAGHGLTFDGIHPTTGVQPLWLLLLVPFARWFAGNGPLALSVALVIVTGLTLICAASFPWLARKLVNDGFKVGLTAALIWAVHPRILHMTFEGTEGALSALAWLVALGVWKSDRGGDRFNVILGIVLGLGCLARIDFLVLAVILLIFTPGKISFRPLRQIIITAGTLAIVALPWPALCWSVTGNPIPDSGIAKSKNADRLDELRELGFEPSSGPMPRWNALDIAMQGPRYLLTTGGRVSRISLVLIPISLTILCIACRTRHRLYSNFPRTIQIATGIWPGIAATFALLVIYPLVMQMMRSWYLAGPMLLMTLLVAAFIIDLASRTNGRRVIACIVAITLWLGSCHIEAALFPQMRQGPAFIIAAEMARSHVSPGSRIGAFNAGILSAWSAPRTTVINLDGVVNHSAIDALNDRDLARYIDRNKIDFIIDLESSVAFFDAIGGRCLLDRLERIETIPTGHGPALGIWRVRKADGNAP